MVKKPKPQWNPNPNFLGVKTYHHSFLDTSKIIRGVKPVYKWPLPQQNLHFDKNIPVQPYNWPAHEYTHYYIQGLRKDPAGVKHVVMYEEDLPTTQPLVIDRSIYPTKVKSFQYGGKLNYDKINREKEKSLNR